MTAKCPHLNNQNFQFFQVKKGVPLKKASRAACNSSNHTSDFLKTTIILCGRNALGKLPTLSQNTEKMFAQGSRFNKINFTALSKTFLIETGFYLFLNCTYVAKTTMTSNHLLGHVKAPAILSISAFAPLVQNQCTESQLMIWHCHENSFDS